MKTLTKLALSAAFIITGQAAAAVEYEVIIERRGYYPTVLHVQAGDTIRFVNKAPNWVRIYSNDAFDNYSGYDPDEPCEDEDEYAGGKDGWSTGWISRNNSTTIDVTLCMETSILAPSVYRYSYNQNSYRGTISFGQPDIGF